MKYIQSIFILCVLFLVVGCNAKTDNLTDVKSQMTLGVYTVPASAGSASEIEPAIRRLLSLRNESDADDLGTVISTGTGQLLVVAPKELQKGMAEFIQHMSKASSAQARPQHNIRQEYWALIGVRNTPVVQQQTPSELSSVVDTIKKESGDEAIVLLEKLSATSLRDEWVVMKGKNMKIEGRVNNQNDQILVSAEVSVLDNALNSKVVVKKGEFLVWGESNIKGMSNEAIQALLGVPVSKDNVRLYIVVRANEL